MNSPEAVTIEVQGGKVYVNGVGFWKQPWGPDQHDAIQADVICYHMGHTLSTLARWRHVSIPTMSKMMAACGLARKRGGVSGAGKKGETE